MAFSKEHRRIAELKNIERHHGFMDVDGATIQECAEFIMTPDTFFHVIRIPFFVAFAFTFLTAFGLVTVGFAGAAGV